MDTKSQQTATQQAIIEAAKAYMEKHGMSENDLAKASKVNGAYLNVIMAGKTRLQSTFITDKWYQKLAEFIGHNVEKKYWETEPTTEFKKLITALERAKEQSACYTVIAGTRRGKTYTKDLFMNKHPKHTYCITVDSLCRVKDIINELCMELDIPLAGTERIRLFSIVQKLRDIKRKGGHPLVIFDEGENMKLSTLQMLKGLYDGISKYSGIVLIGTDQLLENLEKLKKRNKQGMPQLYYRLKAGIKVVRGGQQWLNIIIEKYIQDTGLRRLLKDMCENYGDLNGYIEPALREADKQGVPLTEEFFRVMYDMPE